ncbi:MAG: ABC transporter substrate-binding protein, partial [Thermomicrobiales bacterium]
GLALGSRLSTGHAQDTVVLRVGSWDGVEAEPIEQDVMEGFRQRFPQIDAKFEYNPDAYDEKLLTALAAGNAPDIFLWWNFPSLVQRDGLTDITPLISGDSPLDTSIYYPQILDYNRVGDGLYGLPKDFTPRAYFYNKKLLDAAGIPHPTADWTWDELQEMALALTSGEGVDRQFGFYTYSGYYPLQGYVWSNGGDFVSPDGTEASGYLDSPETLEALDWYIRLQTEHKVAPTQTEEATVGGAGDLFMNGKLAIFDNGRWPQSQFKDVADLDLGTVLPPQSPKGTRVSVLHEAGWCLNPDSEHTAEAWELLKGLAGPEAHRIRAEAGWALPAMPSVAEEMGLLEDPIEKTWFEAVDFATVTACHLRSSNWDRAAAEIDLAIQSAFLGEASIEDAINATVPVVDQILQG